MGCIGGERVPAGRLLEVLDAAGYSPSEVPESLARRVSAMRSGSERFCSVWIADRILTTIGRHVSELDAVDFHESPARPVRRSSAWAPVRLGQ